MHINLFQGVGEEDELTPGDTGNAPFDWLKQWYPLAVADDLDPSRPHAEQLLGATPYRKPLSQDC